MTAMAPRREQKMPARRGTSLRRILRLETSREGPPSPATFPELVHRFEASLALRCNHPELLLALPERIVTRREELDPRVHMKLPKSESQSGALAIGAISKRRPSPTLSKRLPFITTRTKRSKDKRRKGLNRSRMCTKERKNSMLME
jgi:hypothetical protein